jgi:hypothetical protein
MRNRLLSPALLASCLVVHLTGIARADEDDVKVKPLSMTTQVDGGQVVKGNYNGGLLEDQFIQRTSVWITQEIAIGERLDVRAGVGGLFWYATPTPVANGVFSEVAPFSTTTKFGPGITRADMEYRFGDVAAPAFTLQVGYFPYKYNPDAKNLGEYLLRAGAYPSYLITGGWNLISGAGYMMRGVRLNMNLWDGKFRTDFLLPMEQDVPGINGDLSPSVIATVKFGGLEFGTGVNCHHCLPVKPSNTSPKIRPNDNPSLYGVGNGYVLPNPAFDATQPVTEWSGANPRYLIDTTDFYTFQGLKVMARASFDPKALIAMDWLGPEDLKVFGEVAVLGWKNYPFYYEKRSERMPIMVGLNLPAFRFFDVISVQVEKYSSKQTNAMKFSTGPALPMPVPWGFDEAGSPRVDPNLFDLNHKNLTDDDLKWSVYAQKEIVKGLSILTQVANDHIRLPNEWGANPSIPITNSPKDWYYLLRFQLGI